MSISNFYYTYVLACSDGKRYVGFSEDLQTRIQSHKNGEVPATAGRRPINLVYYEACTNKQKAIQWEKYIKSGYGRNFLSKRI